MRLTNFTDYTLRVLIYLGAHRHEGGLATISGVAAAFGIPGDHLRKVVHHLATHGYVETKRGKGGGMRLARAPELINLGEIVRGSEPDFAIVECFQQDKNTCSIVSVCALSGILERALREFFAELDRHTLADLLKPQRDLKRIFRGTGAFR